MDVSRRMIVRVDNHPKVAKAQDGRHPASLSAQQSAFASAFLPQILNANKLAPIHAAKRP
jgi:hypothetical protein